MNQPVVSTVDVELDEVDRRILALLQQDASLTNQALAERVRA